MITSTTNPKIKLVRALQARRSAREAERAYVVEGVRLLEEAARARVPARLVLHAPDLDERGRAAVEALARLGAPVEAVSEGVMAAASDTQTPPGLLAVVPVAPTEAPPGLSLALVIDGVSDPGNLGTILRTADAAGVQAVFLAPGTVDAYNPKVVRAAMGAHFRLPIIDSDWERLPGQLSGLRAWRAEAHGGEPYHQVDWREPSALVIGSEAVGTSPEAQRAVPASVHIPMASQAESLNAAIATAILLFEAARQRRVV